VVKVPIGNRDRREEREKFRFHLRGKKRNIMKLMGKHCSVGVTKGGGKKKGVLRPPHIFKLLDRKKKKEKDTSRYRAPAPKRKKGRGKKKIFILLPSPLRLGRRREGERQYRRRFNKFKFF